MRKSGYSVKVAWDTSSVTEWFDSTLPLKLLPINPDLAMRFRKRFVKGFIIPGANNLYLGAIVGDLLFGVLGFSNADYGNYDLLLKADTTPSDFEKSIDLLLFMLRTKECKNILESKFNRKIDTIYSMCFSRNKVISRYRKHAKLITKKAIYTNKETSDKKTKKAANDKIYRELKKGTIAKQPCEVCGSTEMVEAHHKNYDKPMDVNWLCVKHHNEADAKDETAYELTGYNLGYIFNAGEIPSLKEAKAQFIQKSWKK